jgi:hypothetical protein
VFIALVGLAFVALFDVGADREAHPFPVHSRTKSLFKMCSPRMLQVVVIRSYYTVLKVLGKDKFAICAQNLYILSINSKE